MAARRFKLGSMHIKKRTAGTSNELSFSVLDAKSSTAEDASVASPRTVTELGKVQLFTLPEKQQGEASSATIDFSVPASILAGQKPGVPRLSGGDAAVSTSQEVAQRKKRRRVRRALNAVAVVAALAVVCTVAFGYFSNLIQRHQSDQISIAQAVSLLQQTDEALLALDEAVANEATADQTALTTILSDLSAASTLLDRATNDAELVLSNGDEAVLVEEASYIKESAAARKALMDAGRTVLQEAANAKRATTYLERAWEITVQADTLTRKAADMVATGAQSNIAASNELSTEALALFQEALVLARQAKASYTQVDFSSFETYLEKRSAAQQNALAGNAALQAGDFQAAEANAAAYNEAEEEAAQLAASIQDNPAQPIVDRYAQVGGAAHERYVEARKRAAQADAAIREFSAV